jgi:hypothetical protein
MPQLELFRVFALLNEFKLFFLGLCHYPHQVLGDDSATTSDEAPAGRK